MENLIDKSNSELVMEAKKLTLDHEALRTKMIKDWDKLVELEKEFKKINNILISRNV